MLMLTLACWFRASNPSSVSRPILCCLLSPRTSIRQARAVHSRQRQACWFQDHTRRGESISLAHRMTCCQMRFGGTRPRLVHVMARTSVPVSSFVSSTW